MPGVATVAACKLACLEVSGGACDGFLFQSSTKSCFRKASIDVASCSRDSEFALYLRMDPNRPPSAPRVAHIDGGNARMTSKVCSAAMRNSNHKFYTIWGARGWSARRPGQPACFDAGWFDWVAKGENCYQNWGPNRNAETIFGFKETMEAYCSQAAGHGWNNNGALERACGDANLNILRTGSWNM